MNIIHVNHSSLLVCENGYNLLTDPWYFTNAFDGWAPFPQPDARLIDDIVFGRYAPHIVLISHAHDDHLDERYISMVSNKVTCVIPKSASKSLKRRLIQCGIIESNIVEVGTQPVDLFCFSISSISNYTLSKEDFIFTIATQTGLVVHANDNWHPFSGEVINHILNIARLIPIKFRHLFAQVGVADAFPMFYSELSNSEKLKIIYDKCYKMLSALVSNGMAIQAKQLFAYANQSLFSTNFNPSFNPYLARDHAISSFNPAIIQLLPSHKISENAVINLYENYIPLVVHRLKKLTSMFQQFVDSRVRKIGTSTNSNLLTVEFMCLEYSDLDMPLNIDKIQIISSLQQWNRILQGACNLESLITGGCGQIRVLKSYNMRAEYNLLVDWSYLVHAQIKSGKIFI